MRRCGRPPKSIRAGTTAACGDLRRRWNVLRHRPAKGEQMNLLLRIPVLFGFVTLSACSLVLEERRESRLCSLREKLDAKDANPVNVIILNP